MPKTGATGSVPGIVHAYLRCEPEERDQPVARHRCRGPGPGPRGHHAARLLQGKHKATYTPFIDTGDHVVIINAAKVKLTGRKEDQKIYRRHSGYEGGLREERAQDVRKRQPIRLVEEAIRGMLPKTKMGDAMYRKLKVYAGADHPHAAQQPTKLEVA